VQPVLVLVHSPSLGPGSWEPLATELRKREKQVAVPSLLGVADGPMPVWPRVVDAVAAVVATLPGDAHVVLVVHSNAGLFVPVIVEAAPRPVDAVVFLDAALPTAGGSPVAPPEFLAFLRERADPEGLLPPWTRWWDAADVAPLFPDDATRAAIQAEEPRLPLSYYAQTVPAPQAWEQVPAGYVAFGDAYAEQMEQARSRCWPVAELPGLHLHQLVDPAAVADAVVAVAEQLTPR
jgi:pimeloyl-ACP methyl ester carboxylesterase